MKLPTWDDVKDGTLGEMVRGLYPEAPDDRLIDFLFSCTAYPACDGEWAYKQAVEMRRRTSDFDKAFHLASEDISREFAESQKE